MTTTLPAAVAETHSGIVFFVGDRAFKLKKRVDLGFLDFRSRTAREAACRREVELNRRLVPDVYLGVADVLGEAGDVCDHLVVMRRMPASRRLSTMVTRGDAVRPELVRVARAVAALHERSAPSEAADLAAGADATRRRWEANTDALLDVAPSNVDRDHLALLHGLACRYIDGRRQLFQRRIDAGLAVDGHGDLLADDIFCLPDGPRILDCIEFDDSLRLGDGLADAAFLAMDLERLGRPDLAEHFLGSYGQHRGDTWPASLAHHHVAYRAQVRAKVMAIRAAQGDPAAAPAAADLVELAASHVAAGRVLLVLVGGLPGTGKSTLAADLAAHLRGVLLRSDEVRKELAGLPAGAHATSAYRTGIYTQTMTDETYHGLLARARTAMGHGETVVLDASWASAPLRDLARAAADAAFADVIELRCDAPASVAADRIVRRQAIGQDVSDATPASAEAMAADADPWPEATTIDTTVGGPAGALATAIARIRARVELRPT